MNGLTNIEAKERLIKYGLNVIKKNHNTVISLLLKQFKNPFNIILFIASIISFFTGDDANALIILSLIFISGLLGFYNEYKSDQSLKKLSKAVTFHVIVIREGERKEIDSSLLVPGDLVYFETGTIIPADLELLESNELQIDQSVLTGESMSVDKDVEKDKSLFMGTLVVNGSGTGKVTQTGMNSEYGKIAKDIDEVQPKTSFEKGVEGFSVMVFKIILGVTIFIFITNTLFKHNLLDAILFSVAIAIGLTPEFLPVIITVSLTHGMKKMLKKKVIVKHLTAIEDIGNMNILCTDKTGTLTEGKVVMSKMLNRNFVEDEEMLKYGLLCNTAIMHPRVRGNPIDVSVWNYAIKNKKENIIEGYKKLKEFPFNFMLKIMFVIVEHDHKIYLIAKGAPEEIFSICENKTSLEKFEQHYKQITNEGIRSIALAMKEITTKNIEKPEEEKDFAFLGLLSFEDKPKESAKDSITALNKLGVEIKILTGDNEIITNNICTAIGLKVKGILLGTEIEKLTPHELKNKVEDVTIFARLTPMQKSLIVKLLKEKGNTVGYMGDGINDASSLKDSDVGISVDTAVDIAKDTADIVLLNKSLRIIIDGIIEGRKTFANTTKYILMNVSSDFGNMFSMTIGSLALPFLPLLPSQVLLNDLLYDFAQLPIPTDNVDESDLKRPNEWNIKFIQKFMFIFGPISSFFDLVTFGVLLFFFNANETFFHTGWFIEGLITQIFIVFVVRTKVIPFFKSKVSWKLVLVFLLVSTTAVGLTFTQLGANLGFTQLPMLFFVYLVIAVFFYITTVELVKVVFYKRMLKYI